MKMALLRYCYRFFFILPLLIFAGQANCADIYAYVDTQGKLVISEKKSDVRYVRFDSTRRVTSMSASASSRVMPLKTSWTAKRIASRLAPKPLPEKQTTIDNAPIHGKALHYTPLVNDIADEVGVHANLLHAIIQVESAYNPRATSPKGAQGLMQLIPATAARFGVERSYDPESNVRGGARYVKNLLARFNNNLHLTLAAYNAGEGAVQKYNNTIPPYPETQAYVSKVLALFEQRGGIN